MRDLRQKKSARGEKLAARTIRNFYGMLHWMLHDAQVDEMILGNRAC